MEGLCSKCGTHLAAGWKFCPTCGTTITAEIQHIPAPPEEKAPISGAFGGFFLGIIVAPMMIIVGTLLSLSVVGALIGVPMIIAGILAPLLGPQFGYGVLRGNCPWCGATIHSGLRHAKGFYCHACSNRILIENRRFVRAPYVQPSDLAGSGSQGATAGKA